MGGPDSSEKITRRLDEAIEELAGRRLCRILKKGAAEEVIDDFVDKLGLVSAGFRGAVIKARHAGVSREVQM